MFDSPLVKCPLCMSGYDLRKANVSFFSSATGNRIFLIYALCPDCCFEFNHAKADQKDKIIKFCRQNVVKDDSDAWSVTSSLALYAHRYNFYMACWYGFDIPKPLFDAINTGLIDDFTLLNPSYWGVRND